MLQVHEQKSSLNKMLAQQRFYEYKMDSGGSVVQHIAKVMNLKRALEDLGDKVDDSSVMTKIIGTLPSKYDGFITAWDNMDSSKQTLVNLKERLIKQEFRFAQHDGESSALAVSTSGKKKTNTGSNLGQDTGAVKRSPSDVICYRYKRPGHFARNCRTKKPHPKQKQGEQGSNSKFAGAFVVSAVNGTEQGDTCAITEREQQIMQASTADVWICDSGASRHLTYRRDWLTDFTTCSNETIQLGDDGSCAVVGSGTAHVKKLIDGEWEDARIENVLLVPKLKNNLFSVGVCTSRGLRAIFQENEVSIYHEQTMVARGMKQQNELFRMLITTCPVSQEANVATADLKRWHERLGHACKDTVKKMLDKDMAKGLMVSGRSDFFCEACQIGKSHRLPFYNQEPDKVTRQPGEFFYSDVCGPMQTESLRKAKYFLLFKDAATGYKFVYFLKNKADVYDIFKDFEREICNKFGRPMKYLRTDNGREFYNHNMKKYLSRYGITLETTAPYTPQQNGAAERENRTIVESARTMLHAKQLPYYLWAEAVNCAVYLQNRIPNTRSGNMTPYEHWHGKKPSLQHVRVFGSEAYQHVPKLFRRKLDAKATKVLLVGYEGYSNNYRLFNPTTRQVTQSRDVTFLEESHQIDLESEQAAFLPSIPTVEDERADDVPARPTGTPKGDDNAAHAPCAVDVPDQRAEPLQEVPHQSKDGEGRALRDRNSIKAPKRYDACVAEWQVPQSYKEATEGRGAAHWRKAIEEELDAHQQNNTWTIISRPNDCKPIDTKWVFKLQTNKDGHGKRFKARLCARGFKQVYGIDYKETFSPVVRYDSIRVLLALAASNDLEMKQFDVKTAFLYGDLRENIYVTLPEGVVSASDVVNPVCKLNKALYGLKQASRCWSKTFNDFMTKFGFCSCESDSSIFCGKVNNVNVIIAIFVDDGLIMSETIDAINIVTLELRKRFDIVVNEPNTFVGVQIERNRHEKTIRIHQSDYALKVLERFNMLDAKSVCTPAEPGLDLRDNTATDASENVPYRELVGSLMFLCNVTRPDISFAVNIVSRYVNNFGRNHWEACKRILKYLRGTHNLGIYYCKGGTFSLSGYCDADFAGDVNTRRSTSGFLFELASGLVSWSSQRQKSVALSTTEAEYVAASMATREAVWLSRLMKDIGCPASSAINLYTDNQSALRLVKNPEFHKRTKHIDIHYHFIREKYEENVIDVMYVPSENQKADIFTKPMPRDRFQRLCDAMGLSN